MAIKKRGKSGIYWIDLTDPKGNRIRKTTGTKVKKEAEEFHDKFKAELWNKTYLQNKKRRSWEELKEAYLKSKKNKKSINSLRTNVALLDPYLENKYLDEIDSELINEITTSELNRFATNYKYSNKKISHYTINLTLSIMRAMLFFAKNKLNWINSFPTINTVEISKAKKNRCYFLTRDQAQLIQKELAPHLLPMFNFSLATGLRENNVVTIKWSQIDLDKKTAWIFPDDSKNASMIIIPLSDWAIQILNKQIGGHDEYVFVYKGKPVKKANNWSWRRAIDRAGIKPLITKSDQRYNSTKYPTKPLDEYALPEFRWHDLRHTWASWHVQEDTPLPVLQKLGGWSSIKMVLRYAHFNKSHIDAYANNVVEPE